MQLLTQGYKFTSVKSVPIKPSILSKVLEVPSENAIVLGAPSVML